MLKGKKILLGITGSIAAYKSILLTRELVREGAQVKVICTPDALDFVTPLTLATLSNGPVYSSFVTDQQAGTWVNHVELAKWADAMIIAPLTANTLGKMCSGQCDNLLLATYLSCTAPLIVAPAMDLDMYGHWTTARNLDSLRHHGVHVLDAGVGELASGLVGQGRMCEPEDIVSHLRRILQTPGPLKGKKVLVTAGPTYEAIDPVRFIGNHSSGKMGFAIAEQAALRGAQVVLISGPTTLRDPIGVQVIRVTSANEMAEAVRAHFPAMDVAVMAAAVADYKPKQAFAQKLKKETSQWNTIELEKTVDILSEMGRSKGNTVLVGFALETEDELLNARKKLENKNLDMLVMNSLRDEGAGFGTETNKVTFVYPDRIESGTLKSKKDVAYDILDAIEKLV